MERYPTTGTHGSGRQLSGEFRSDQAELQKRRRSGLKTDKICRTLFSQNDCGPLTVFDFLNDPVHCECLSLSFTLDVGLTWITLSPSLIGLRAARHWVAHRSQRVTLTSNNTIFYFHTCSIVTTNNNKWEYICVLACKGQWKTEI